MNKQTVHTSIWLLFFYTCPWSWVMRMEWRTVEKSVQTWCIGVCMPFIYSNIPHYLFTAKVFTGFLRIFSYNYTLFCAIIYWCVVKNFIEYNEWVFEYGIYVVESRFLRCGGFRDFFNENEILLFSYLFGLFCFTTSFDLYSSTNHRFIYYDSSCACARACPYAHGCSFN